MMDSGPGLGVSGSFKHQALKNSKGKDFWDTFSETSASGRRGPPRITPPPPLFGLARGSSAGLSVDDVNMDSPSAASSNGTRDAATPFAVPGPVTASSSSGNDTPGQQAAIAASSNASGTGYVTTTTTTAGVGMPPSAAEITRRINNKRRRDDDFDPVSFKRRAVSPGMSVHNSPIMQSPLQRDVAPWGGSRPGSVGGDTTGKSGAPSESGSQGSRGGKGRVGYQGMVDTNDGITKLSIE